MFDDALRCHGNEDDGDIAHHANQCQDSNAHWSEYGKEFRWE